MIRPITHSNIEKKYQTALNFGLLIYVCIIVLPAVYPMGLPAVEWRMDQGLQSLVFDEHILLTFRFVESIAAFTLLGYSIYRLQLAATERLNF